MSDVKTVDITVADLNFQVIEVPLGDKTWFIRINWNEYGQFFTMDINDYSDTVVVRGIRLIANTILAPDYITTTNMPQGVFYVVSQRDEAVLRNDFIDGIAILRYYFV